MRSLRVIFFFFICVFFKPFTLQAQISIGSGNSGGSPERLALMYFEQKEFDKALVYFEDLFEKRPDSWFNYYFKSLLEVKDYKKAEKVTKRMLKYNPKNVSFHVHLGRVYFLMADQKKEKEAYEKALKELGNMQPEILNLANVFVEYRLFDYALAVYNRARKMTEFPYYYERAELFREKNDLGGMINEYLDALDFRESELEVVKRQLQTSLGYDDEEGGIKHPLLRQELQKRIQKDPDKIVFTEFLIFIQIQQKDFEGAFVQERALDKRLKREGYKIYELAKICVSNGHYETAKRCFDYLIEKGPASVYYDLALIDGLNMQYLINSQKAEVRHEELIDLEQKLEKAHEKYRNLPVDTQIVRNLANVKAYYLNKGEAAINLLEEFIRQPTLNTLVKARFKIALGDIYLINGAIWDASLLYSQVEKDFKHDAIGFDAKFRNARLSFFAGDFVWAKTQADVLKGATTKLIANDALDLSLIISDAIGVDTNDLPLRLFASAELMVLQHKYNEAVNRMDSINLLFSNHTLGDDIYFKKAAIYTQLGKYKEAAEMYSNIVTYYPNDLYGDDAQFKLAELYELKLQDQSKAKQAYEDVLTKYPGSIYTVEARKRFRTLRGDNFNN